MAQDVRFGYKIIEKWPEYCLFDKGESVGNQGRWIIAHYPEYDKDGNTTSWGYGHYFNSLIEAVDYYKTELERNKEEQQEVCHDDLEEHDSDPDVDPDI